MTARALVATSWMVAGVLLVAKAQHPTTGMLISLPVMLTAWVYRKRGAVVAALLSFPFTLTCLALGGEQLSMRLADPSLTLGHLFTGLFAYFLGWSRSLRDRLETEVDRRIASEKARVQAEMEAQLLRADRLATVGTMAAGVAHEVNNPLTYVLANVELASIELERLRARCGADESALDEELAQLAEGLAEIEDGAERIRSIMSELKLFVREHNEEFSPIDLHGVAQTSAKLARHELDPGIEFVQRLDPVPRILGDAGKLAQVFVNLLVNAAQAMPEGRRGGRIELALEATADEVIASVSDDGIGMSAETRSRIFEPFFTTKPVGVGTGLGLAVCASIVRQHHGALELDSELGRGTTFRLRFPLRPRET